MPQSSSARADLVVLLTGFEPFGDDAHNPSGASAKRWNGTELAVDGPSGPVRARIVGEGDVPVVFHDILDPANPGTGTGGVARAIEIFAPDVVIALGQTSARAFHLERRAHNVLLRGRKDDTGREYAPAGAVATSDGRGTFHHGSFGVALEAKLPLEAIGEALRKLGARCETSDDAGGYVCSDVMFEVLRQCREPNRRILRGGFIHVPRLVLGATGELLNAPLTERGDSIADAVSQDFVDRCVLAAVEATLRDLRPEEIAAVGKPTR